MAEKRKLLNEIDKCFKKVDEGFEIFDEIMEKMAEANSDNQREKFQDDLKKEIKKLQRLRDQIKMWHNSSDIKDKEGLAKYRKLIEQRMESFKEIEKENKTKPYSKQGLAVEDEIDPKEKEKNEAIEWFNCQIRSLHEEIDKAESKLEILTTEAEVTGRKRRKQSIYLKEEELKGHIERVKFHLLNWEVVLRLITNDKLEVAEVLELFERPIEDYINGLDPETDCVLAELDSCLADIYEELDIASHIPQLAVQTSFIADEERKIVPESIQMKPALNYIVPSAQNSVMVNQLKPASSPVTASSLVRNDNEGLSQTPLTSAWSNVAASALPKSNEVSFAEKEEKKSLPESVHLKPALTYIVPSAQTSIVPPHLCSPTMVSSVFRKENDAQSPAHSLPAWSNVAASAVPKLNHLFLNEAKKAVPESIKLKPALVYSTPSAQNFATLNHQLEHASSPDVVSSLVQKEEEMQSHMPPMSVWSNVGASVDVNNIECKISPWLGASPLGMEVMSEEMKRQLKMLEAAVSRDPQQIDSEKIKSYLPKSRCVTPSYYPKEPHPMADTLEYYMKLSLETLFFNFYYMEGTRAQMLAAKALKKQSWRFHTKFLMWFQRHEQPIVVTEDFEKGAYLYFDFEKWAQRKKDNFTFEYKFLEDSNAFDE